MRPLMACLSGSVVWAALALPVSAGWDNVFQPTLFHRRTTTSQYYVPPVVVSSSPIVSVPVVAQSAPCTSCAPPPQQQQQQCSTSYTQRCYYQPVTSYQTKTYYEPVTTYRTSYYYEPVTSYRYSCYYDPCTCTQQQVAVPTTSYQLRAQNCPVQSWVARCAQEPVTTYQKACYWQPQTTCCTTTQGAPILTSGQAPPQQPPLVNGLPSQPQQQPQQQPPQQQQQQQPPQINAYSAPAQTQPPPSISGTRSGNDPSKSNLWQQYYPPMEKAPEIRGLTPGTSWQPQLGQPVPVQPSNPPSPPVKVERIAVGPNSQVEGQVLRNDNSPKANAKLLFINAGSGQKQTVYANAAGRFQVELPAGSWHLYLHGADDVPVHQRRIDVNGAQYRQVNLVSRGN